MEEDSIIQILSLALIVLICVLFILCISYLIVILRDKSKKKVKQGNKELKNNEQSDNNQNKEKSSKEKVTTTYVKQSIFDFMEFENIQDNMIIQKKGKRYLMVVECQGVNYDLMSKMEKNAVEEGFQQFLNTLRHPIQIYIQTRTMNLEKSIQNYKDKVKLLESQYNKIKREYTMAKEGGGYDKEELNKQYFELTRARNILEYGKDIIKNIERMSLNKNVLTQKYYVVIPYYSEEDSNYSIDEIRNMAFSELYTKAQAIISTLSSCSVVGRILNSNELIELLYVAFNREEADVYGLNKALKAQYDSLYSMAPDVFEKKTKILDEVIKEKAIDLANEKIEEVKTKQQQEAEEKQKNLDYLISKMAQMVLEENKAYVGEEVANRAISELEKTQLEEGGKGNVQIEKKSRKPRRNNKN